MDLDKNGSEELDTSLEQNLTNYMEKIKREVEEKTVPYDNYQLIYGNAETPCEESDVTCPQEFFPSTVTMNSRVVDFDNDGRMECVKKTIWYPGSQDIELCLK